MHFPFLTYKTVELKRFTFGTIIVFLFITFYVIIFKSKDFTNESETIKTDETIIMEMNNKYVDETFPLTEEFHLNPTNWRNLTKTQIDSLSNLGRFLYLDTIPPHVNSHNENYHYKILVWKYGSTIYRRHLYQFTNTKSNPFDGCTVTNCQLLYNDSEQMTADAVIFHMQRMRTTDPLPSVQPLGQLWIMLNDESTRTFRSQRSITDLNRYNRRFHWMMTYRLDSEVPVPYGRTVRLQTDQFLEQYRLRKRHDVLVTIMMSNCQTSNQRRRYVNVLQRYIDVHIYGGCGPYYNVCQGHFARDCPTIGDYLFYLAFENSNCADYLTEKVWWNGLGKGAIPVIMGPDRRNCERLLPPRSFLHVEDYTSAKVLAEYLLYLNATGEYRRYHQWRRQYHVVQEHGYFGTKSKHFCRICEALNYNQHNTNRTYENLANHWNVSQQCHPPINL